MAQTRRRLRRVAKWTGLAIVVLVLGADAASGWLTVDIPGPCEHSFELLTGRVWVIRGTFQGIGLRWNDRWQVKWSFNRAHYPAAVGGRVEWQIPVWFIALVPALPTACLWWLDRRDKGPGHCQRCGYDLTGLAPGTTCPECGKATTKPAA